MAPSATISVDVQGLKDLAGQCRRASSSLVSDTGLFNEGTNGIEHSGLTAAVNKFEERWSDKRHKIQDALDKSNKAQNIRRKSVHAEPPSASDRPRHHVEVRWRRSQ